MERRLLYWIYTFIVEEPPREKYIAYTGTTLSSRASTKLRGILEVE
jgi:hypothetical protein